MMHPLEMKWELLRVVDEKEGKTMMMHGNHVLVEILL
jgi:hypothetical protein